MNLNKYLFDVVFIVRHGQTLWNTQGRHQGRLDSPLTDLGRRQAMAVGTYLSKHHPIDRVVSSTAARAQATSKIIAEKLGVEVMPHQTLQEIDQGRWSGLTDSEIDVIFPGARTRRADDKYHWRFPAGESYEDAYLRAQEALLGVAALGVKSPVLVTHEMFSRMLIRRLLNQSIDEGMANRLAHGEILKWNRHTPSVKRMCAKIEE